MAKKVKISDSHYPSDRDIFDLVMSKGTNLKLLQELLWRIGIYFPQRDRLRMAVATSRLKLDNATLQALFSTTNLREDRVKTSVAHLSIVGFELADVYEALGTLTLDDSHGDPRLKLSDGSAVPTLDKSNQTIKLRQKFKKIDFSKTNLLQQEDHEFTVTIEQKEAGSFVVTYSSSDPAGDQYVDSLRSMLSKKVTEKSTKADPYFHEVSLQEIAPEKINDFFHLLISDSKGLGMSLEQVNKVTMSKQIHKKTDDDSSEEEPEDEKKDGEAVINNLKFEGQNLFNHPDIKNYVSQGYFVKTLTGIFSSGGGGRTKYLTELSVGFGNSNKFFSEISNSWTLAPGEGEKMDKRVLSADVRESLLKPVNETAIEIFDKIREDTLKR